MFEHGGVLGCLTGFDAGTRSWSGRAPDMRRSGKSHTLLTALYLSFLILLLAPILVTPALSFPSDAKQEIRCLVFFEGNAGYEERIQAVFEDANKYLEREGAEILLVPSASSRQIEFEGDTPRKMLNELRKAAASSSETWDLAIAFTNGPLQGPNGENWSGVIEKRESRHIIIKCLNRNTLLHEIGHALGLPHGTGIMLPTLKTNYVAIEREYQEALKTAKEVFSRRAIVSNRYGTASAAQRIPPSIKVAQATGN